MSSLLASDLGTECRGLLLIRVGDTWLWWREGEVFIMQGEEASMLEVEWLGRGNVSSEEDENDGRGTSLSTGERKET